MKIDRKKVVLWIVKSMLWGVILCTVFLMLVSCAAPKAVEERRSHESEVDTMVVRAVVDKRMNEVKELVTHELRDAFSAQQTEQQSQEQEKERITETITTWVDSLGREMRQEQRTTERDISRQQQMRDEQMQQVYEQRLLSVTDSLDAAWQERFGSMQAHREEADSTFTSVTPKAGDNRPWWKRVWDAVEWMLVGAVVGVVLCLTRKMWLTWFPFGR